MTPFKPNLLTDGFTVLRTQFGIGPKALHAMDADVQEMVIQALDDHMREISPHTRKKLRGVLALAMHITYGN